NGPRSMASVRINAGRATTVGETSRWADRGASFRRQHPAGSYVLDFYCPILRIAVEVDGGGHGHFSGAQRDARRDAWLRDNGVLVLRFWNNEVRSNLYGVCETVRLAVLERAEQVRGPV